ncbi:helix-turn-helix domain-containing protein [Bacillus cereus]|uniref:helix-turn-helix domain-containing protein n=1 Tax=Bacillus cereus TaxID=1396 RepID=UPI00016B834F|nr:helix-turn-helix domain-containing protein [Bacillus cereus]PGB51161.1 helix-turn-helix domain-containing protein [Bacillus anthracis]PYD97031.1 helix-turn-helix domain-containing protein [Bacillus cereus]
MLVLTFYKDGYHSIVDVTAKFSVNSGAIRAWKISYEVNGEDGLEEVLSWKKEIKIDLSVERNCH